MNTENQTAAITACKQPARVFSILFGAFLGLSLVKFGNPAVLEKMVEWPTTGWEWVFNPWPVAMGFCLLGVLAVGGFFIARWPRDKLRPLVFLPLFWLGWQFVSATCTVDAGLTATTLKHFAASVGCFYLGFLALSRVRNAPLLFFSGLLCGLLVIVAVGWEQHFGGLDESRRYFFAYIYPQLNSISLEYLKKISSDRIFSTLFYPNALAGVLLLLLPVILTTIWNDLTVLTKAARRFLAVALAGAALACLYWSKSKGGWLLMLALGGVALMHLQSGWKWKAALVTLTFVFGLAIFSVRFSSYFTTGATSVNARLDYWQAAIRTAAANPVFGTGPGTFAIPYKQIKKPESEMARLVHNDYLEQASDSGIVGFSAYLAFIVGILVYTAPKAGANPLQFAVWLGLLGWSLHGLMEFGLYIPALAWPAFSLMGWLLAGANQFDKPKTTS